LAEEDHPAGFCVVVEEVEEDDELDEDVGYDLFGGVKRGWRK